MMKNRFLLPKIGKAGEELLLTDSESHHLAKVFRTKPGEEIVLINGLGQVAAATFLQLEGRRARVRIDNVETATEPSRVTIAFGLPKGQALDFLIHRCTEIGIKQFQPLETDHSLAKTTWNPERWKRVIEEVAKQCQDPFFPALLEPVELPLWLEKREKGALYCCLESERHLSPPLTHSLAVDVVVGPEGGWSEREIDLLKQTEGFINLSLGKNRLRAETAALTAAILAKRSVGEL